MSGVNTSAFLELLKDNAESIQQNTELINNLGNISASNIGSTVTAVQAAQNAEDALNAFEVTVDGLNQRIIQNTSNIDDNKTDINNYKLEQETKNENLKTINDNLNAQFDTLKYSVNEGERHAVNKVIVNTSVDPMLRNMGLNESSNLEVKRAYANVNDSKVDLNNVVTAKVGQADFDANGRLVYHHENVRDVLKLPFFSQGSVEEYAKFTATNVWELIGADAIIPEPTENDTPVRVQYLQQMKDLKELIDNRRDTLSSEGLLKQPGEYKPFESLGGGGGPSITSLSPEEIKEKYLPTTFGTITNEALDNNEERFLQKAFTYINPERTNPNTYDFMVDYNQFEPVYLGNSERVSWLHWLISSKLFNAGNIMPVLEVEDKATLAIAGYDKNYSCISNRPEVKEYWNINSIKRLWPDSDVLHINANVDTGVFGESPMSTFSLLAKSTVCWPIEFIIDEMENHPEEYENMSGNDTFLKLIMRLFKSEEKYQKAKYTTASAYYTVENTVNGHLPAIDPTKSLAENKFVMKPLTFETVIEYDVTDAGWEYFVSQQFESVQDLYNAVTNVNLVRRKVVDISNKLVDGNPDIALVASQGTYGTSSYSSADETYLRLLKEAKSGLVYDDLKLLKDKLGTPEQLDYSLKESYNKNSKEIVGYLIFADTPIEQVKEIFEAGELDVNFGKLEGVEANTLGDYALYYGKAHANLSVCSDLERMALLIFNNRFATWKLLQDAEALGNKYAMSTEEAKEYMQKMLDDIYANYTGAKSLLFSETDFTNEVNNFGITFNTSQDGVSESFDIDQYNKETYTVTRTLLEKGMNEHMNYTIVDPEYNSKVQTEYNLSHPILEARTPVLKDGLANELSAINSKSSEENLINVNAAFTKVFNVYADLYRRVMNNSALQLQNEKNVIAVDASMNDNDIIEAVFKFLNTASIEDNLAIFERMHELLKENLYQELNIDIETYVPTSTKGVVMENHSRISGANVPIVVKSFTAAFVLQDVCKVTEAKVFAYQGSSTKINWIIELTRYINDSVINTNVDNNSQPMYAYSGNEEAFKYDYTKDDVGNYDSSEGLVNWHLGMKFKNSVTNVFFFLQQWSVQFAGASHPINTEDIERPYTPVNFGWMMNLVALIFGNSNLTLSLFGGYFISWSISEKIQKIAMAYRMLPIKDYGTDLYTELDTLPRNNFFETFNMFLDSTISRDEYPILGNTFTGITDPVGLEEANQVVLSLFKPGTILRNMIQNYINTHGSIKPIFAMGHFTDYIYLLSDFGFLNDYTTTTAYDVIISLINDNNRKVIDALEIYKALVDLRTSESISEVYYSKSTYPSKVPVDGNGVPLLLSVESTYANKDLILNQNN